MFDMFQCSNSFLFLFLIFDNELDMRSGFSIKNLLVIFITFDECLVTSTLSYFVFVSVTMHEIL
jgi:hypothetical protein